LQPLRQQHPPTTVVEEPAPSTPRAGRNLPPYGLGHEVVKQIAQPAL
jgi:hypothetical protein